MTVTVLDSADLVESVTTGKVPVPKGIAEDNAAQAAKRDTNGKFTAKDDGANHQPSAKAVGDGKADAAAKSASDSAAAKDDPAPDDIEDERGITPRQKREYTEQMLKTIAKKHRAQREAEETATRLYNETRMSDERASRLERELAEMRKQLPSARTEEVAAATAPDRTKFANESDYQDAVIEYKVDQRIKAAEATAAKAREEAEQAQVVQQATARIEQAREIVPDFDEVVGSVDTIVPDHIAGYMQNSDLFAETAYHFAKHPEELARLKGYTEGKRAGTVEYVKGITRSLVELGKIESRIQPFAPVAEADTPNAEDRKVEEARSITGQAPSKPRVTAPIISPLNGGSASQVDKDPGDWSVKDHRRATEKKYGTNLMARKRH